MLDGESSRGRHRSLKKIRGVGLALCWVGAVDFPAIPNGGAFIMKLSRSGTPKRRVQGKIVSASRLPCGPRKKMFRYT